VPVENARGAGAELAAIDETANQPTKDIVETATSQSPQKLRI
jgi:hypothetical protein